jgi:uncharacterized protein (DUF1015 family)
MAELVPFRGLRYRADLAGGLGAVIAPPYDVISAQQQESLYERSPYNVIRLEYGREPAPERYALAARALADWRANGAALKEERRPALYRYTQRFAHGGRTYERTALIGRVKLEPLDAGVIRPHEYTMAKPKEDRLALLRATRTNTSPVYSLVDDADGRFKRALAGVPAAERAAGEDLAGQSHEIEVITDEAAIAALVESVRDRPLYIADGHHRYETALAYRAERPDDPAAGYVLMAVSAADDPGLLILPIHRLVRPRTPRPDLEERLARLFALDDAGSLDDDAAVGRLAAGLHASPDDLTLGALGVRPGRLLRLDLRDRAVVESTMPAERTPAWKQLAVNVLQFGVLDPLLGIDADALVSGEYVEFSEDALEAAAAVRRGHVPLAFLVPATRPDELIAVADAGDRMPQKSTYFYPKLGTGLVLNAHDVDGSVR